MDYASSLQCAWAAIHLFGIAAACSVRVYAGTAAEAILQAMFLMGLAGVAVATLAGQEFGWSPWPLSAATMATMIVVVVADFGGRRTEAMA